VFTSLPGEGPISWHELLEVRGNIAAGVIGRRE
jgi:hypothetical protein